MHVFRLDRVLVLSMVSLASLGCGPGAPSATGADGSETGTTGDGDGDGDGESSGMTGDGDGDGDGEPGDGDGDPGDGDPGDGDGDGDPGDGDGDGDSGDGDGDSGDGDGDGDSGDGDGDPIAPWLLSVNNQTHELLKISTDDATTVVLCQLDVDDTYPSTTFGLDGTLYGSNGPAQTLDIIDPCTCEVTTIGPTNYGSIPGITANGLEIEVLFGVSVSADLLLTLSTLDGAGTEIGPLGLDFHFSGTTWSSDLLGLYAINDTTNTLYTLDTTQGTANPVAVIDTPFDSVGVEWHPDTTQLYACTNFGGSSRLYIIDVDDASATLVGNLGHNCNNLAAPWTEVGCVDDVPFNP